MKIINTKVDDYVIEGYESDYIFQTINSSNNFYEIYILDKWTEKFSEAKVILDIGANIGNHTLYWSKKLNYKSIYSFEPYKPTFERLKNNINNNNLINVVPINKGVGNINGFAQASFIDESNMGSTTLEYCNEKDNEKIEIVSIDSFVEENNIKDIDFIKIDVESFELLVLQGMKKVLNEMKPDLWIEVTVETYKKVIDDLKNMDYYPVDIEGFNILFLNKCRHEKLENYDSEKVLKNMFIYLQKTNIYYNNYLKCKEWLRNKNEQVENQRLNYNILKEKNEKIIEEKRELLEKVENFNDEKKSLSKIVQKLVNDFEDEKSILMETKALINKLETQNSYLKHENNEYKRKLSLITDTFFGKLGIKVYKTLKKIKSKLKQGGC